MTNRLDEKTEANLSEGDKRVAHSLLPLLVHRRDALGRAIEALGELQRTNITGDIALGVVAEMLHSSEARAEEETK